MFKLGIVLSLALCTNAFAAEAVNLFIGSYTSKESDGIYTLRYFPQTNRFDSPKLAAATDNPSYLIDTPAYLYAVNEIKQGHISSFKKNEGALIPENTIALDGASPCHLAFHPHDTQLAIANYTSGNVSLLEIKNGVAQAEVATIQHQGKGPNPARQEAPHAHWVGWHPKNKRLYVVDLGIDQVRFYDTSRPNDQGKTALNLKPGDGPRHLAFHPHKPLVYILNELSNVLTTAKIHGDGTFESIARTSTLPADFKAHSQAAHIQINEAGTTLYVSNRGHNSVAVFSLDQNGLASIVQHQASGGDWPRHFTVLEHEGLAFVANQKSHNITAFKLLKTGMLRPMNAQAEVAQPTFVGKAQ